MPEPICLSPSNVNELQCPARFRELRELRKWPSKPSASVLEASARGKALHAVCARLYDPIGAEFVPDFSRLEAAVDVGIGLLSVRVDDEEARQWLRELACIYAGHDDRTIRVLGVEVEHQIPQSRGGVVLAYMEARHDRVQVPVGEPETLEVVDISLGRKRLHPWSVFVSLAVAKARWPGYKKHRMVIHRLGANGVEEERHSGSEYKGVSAQIAEAVAEYHAFHATGAYPHRLCESCLWCPIKPKCPLHKPIDVADLDFDEEP